MIPCTTAATTKNNMCASFFSFFFKTLLSYKLTFSYCRTH